MAEPSPTIPMERSFYIGNAFCAILYGFQLSLCFQSIHYLRKGSFSNGHKLFFICYSLALATLRGIGLASNMLYGQLTWIEHRTDLPGGATEYFLSNTNWWFNTMGTAAGIVSTTLSDGLLLYRCYVILGHSWVVLILPTLLYLAAIALGVLSTILSALPGHFIYGSKVAQFAVSWISTSVSFNVLVTLMISIRLLYAHRQMREYTSREYMETYTGVVAILIESAFPLAVTGLITSILFGIEHPAAMAVTVIWGVFVGISPQLIILRVAMGKAWSDDTMSQTRSTAMTFQSKSNGSRTVQMSSTHPYESSKKSTLGGDSEKGVERSMDNIVPV